MPEKAVDVNVVEYPLSRLGINLQKNIVELSSEECLLSQNLIWRNGIVKRGGQDLGINNTEVVASNKIQGLHRFYFGASRLLLAAADDKVRKDAGSNIWTTIHTFLTADQEVTMNTWGALNKEYIANGLDRAVHYDGTTVVSSATSTLTVNSQPTAGQNSEVILIIDSTVFTGIEGTDWDVGADVDATAADIELWIEGLGATTSSTVATNVITVTPTATTDIEKFEWNQEGTDTAAMVTVSHFAAPAKAIQFLSYQDRLLVIDDNDPGELKWFKSFSDSELELRNSTNVRPDIKLYGMIIHSLANSDSGFRSAVLLAGATSMYLFQGTILIPPATTSGTDYTIYPLPTNVGCNAPKTMAWTPAGSMWLGIDRQVYILPFNSVTAVPIGNKIQSTSEQSGIEEIPAAQISNACAVYHDGFYKLSISSAGQTTNNIQYWLDITRLNKDEDGHFGPWYGPMLGQTINIFANQNGPGDSGQLVAGESTAKGFVYETSKAGVASDIEPSDKSAKIISVLWKTFFNPLSVNFEFTKLVDAIELELLDINANVTLDLHDIEGSVRSSVGISLIGGSIKWGDFNWGDFNWSGNNPIRRAIDLSPGVLLRRMAILVKSSSSDADFQLYALRAKTRENRLVFEGNLNN